MGAAMSAWVAPVTVIFIGVCLWLAVLQARKRK